MSSKGSGWPIRLHQVLTLKDCTLVRSFLLLLGLFIPHNKLLVQKTKISLQLMVLQVMLTQGLRRKTEINSQNIFFRTEAIVIIACRLDQAHFTASNCSWDCTNAGVARIDRAAASGQAGRGSKGWEVVCLHFSKSLLPARLCLSRGGSFTVLNGLVVTRIIVLNYV